MYTINSFIVKTDISGVESFIKMLNEEFGETFNYEIISQDAQLFLFKSEKDLNKSCAIIWEFIHKPKQDEISFVEPCFVEETNVNIYGDLASCEYHLPGTEDTVWHLKQLKIAEAWKYSKSLNKPEKGLGVKIGHTDTGYTQHDTIYHQGLLVNEGYNFFNGNNSSYDHYPNGGINHHGHGTSTGSLMIGNGKYGIYGAAPLAKLVPIRVDQSVIMQHVNYIKGVQHAINTKCQIISTSMGLIQLGHFQSIDSVLRSAIQAGIIPIAAAGQAGGFPVDLFPASSSYCISCTASTIGRHPWSKAFKSRRIDIAAPGESIFVADVTKANDKNLVERYCGTSFSTALVAASAALWYAHWGVSYLQNLYGKASVFSLFKNTLMSYATDAKGWNTQEYGPGILNTEALLKAPVSGSNIKESDGLLVSKSDGMEIITRKLGNDIALLSEKTLMLLSEKVSLQQELIFHLQSQQENTLLDILKNKENINKEDINQHYSKSLLKIL